MVVLSWYLCNCNPVVPHYYKPRVICLCHRCRCLKQCLYLWWSWWWSMCKTVLTCYWWCKFLECWLLFVSWWFWPVVIMTPLESYMLMTGSFLHMTPFPSRGSTWHPLIIFHRFLVLSCFCLHFYYGQISLTRVVYVLGVVALDFCDRQYFIGGGWSLSL